MFELESSVEHISDEKTDDPVTLNIGNLILLEQRINSSIPCNKEITEKREYYQKSKYTSVHTFLEKTKDKTTWNDTDIKSRSRTFAEDYYDKLVDLIKKI